MPVSCEAANLAEGLKLAKGLRAAKQLHKLAEGQPMLGALWLTTVGITPPRLTRGCLLPACLTSVVCDQHLADGNLSGHLAVT